MTIEVVDYNDALRFRKLHRLIVGDCDIVEPEDAFVKLLSPRHMPLLDHLALQPYMNDSAAIFTWTPIFAQITSLALYAESGSSELADMLGRVSSATNLKHLELSTWAKKRWDWTLFDDVPVSLVSLYLCSSIFERCTARKDYIDRGARKFLAKLAERQQGKEKIGRIVVNMAENEFKWDDSSLDLSSFEWKNGVHSSGGMNIMNRDLSIDSSDNLFYTIFNFFPLLLFQICTYLYRIACLVKFINCIPIAFFPQYFEGCLSSVPPSTRIHSPLTNRLTTSDNATLPTSFAVPDPPTGVSNPNSFDSNEPTLANPKSVFASESRKNDRELTLFRADSVVIYCSRS